MGEIRTEYGVEDTFLEHARANIFLSVQAKTRGSVFPYFPALGPDTPAMVNHTAYYYHSVSYDKTTSMEDLCNLCGRSSSVEIPVAILYRL